MVRPQPTQPVLNGSDVFISRIKAARKAKRWTQAELAEECDRIGHWISRSVLGFLESPGSRNRRKVTIDDLFAISYALGVAPSSMITPLEDDAEVRVAPGIKPLPAASIRRWVEGDLPLGATTIEDRDFYDSQVPLRQRPSARWAPVEDVLRAATDLVYRYPSPPRNDEEEVAAVQQIRVLLDILTRSINEFRRKLEKRDMDLNLREAPLPADPTAFREPAKARALDNDAAEGARQHKDEYPHDI